MQKGGLLADGVAGRKIGEETCRVARHLVDGTVKVSVDEICAATRDIFYDKRALPEPDGALAVAGLKRWVQEHGVRGKTLAAILRSEEHTSELQSLMRISYAVFCLKKKKHTNTGH